MKPETGSWGVAGSEGQMSAPFSPPLTSPSTFPAWFPVALVKRAAAIASREMPLPTHDGRAGGSTSLDYDSAQRLLINRGLGTDTALGFAGASKNNVTPSY